MGGTLLLSPIYLASICSFLASERNIDVVLVDTAGRMQDNEPLMRSLAKVFHSLRKYFLSFFHLTCMSIYYSVFVRRSGID